VSPPGKPPESGAGGLPFVFVDRSLGRIRFPALLRDAGVELVTLAEHYGIPADEDVADVDWILEAAGRGWVLFMKDAAIRRRPAERQAIMMSGAKCFCLANAGVDAAEAARRHVDNLAQIAKACAEPGPFLYAVQMGRIERLPLDA
jgi:hypothetical protein